MIVLSAETKTEDPRFLMLTVEGAFWREVYKSLFVKHLAFLRRSADRSELESRWKEVEMKAAKEAALRLLALRSYSSCELSEKLLLRGLSSFAIEKALEECARLGYLDDQEEARRFVEKEMKRGYGSYLISLKLKRRGMVVSSELLALMQKEQQKQIEHLLQTRFRKLSLKIPKERQKIAMALKRRGFDLESIGSLIYKLL